MAIEEGLEIEYVLATYLYRDLNEEIYVQQPSKMKKKVGTELSGRC